jgi:hypothetical protein
MVCASRIREGARLLRGPNCAVDEMLVVVPVVPVVPRVGSGAHTPAFFRREYW